MKAMLASDYNEAKLKFPLLAQPKIDGVRCINLEGNPGLTGRSLKSHANKFVTQFFSHEALQGLDGEMAAERETHPDLCRITTSAMSTIEGEPFTLWWLFDFVCPETKSISYEHRYEALKLRVEQLQEEHPTLAQRLRIVPSVPCYNLEQLLEVDDYFLEQGYEGTIIRDPHGFYKEGRSTVREGGLLRIKRFIDAEIVVTQILEGETNTNEAQINELGRTFRTTHQENMVPNGMVGAILGTLLKDVLDAKGNVLFKEGEVIKVSPGKMPHEDRVRYFQQQELLLGQIVKFKLFPKGVKDKPRFPTFQSLRSATDL